MRKYCVKLVGRRSGSQIQWSVSERRLETKKKTYTNKQTYALSLIDKINTIQ